MSEFAKILDEMDFEQRQSPVIQALKLESILNVAELNARQDRLKASIDAITSRPAPARNLCVFCSGTEEATAHPCGRCPPYTDSVARAVQA
ncbi:unnamed protein product [Strongylus vulgaris]|uniref:Uncharacterized protein n=1 Tax=Strongylus vulgaris TaxID=40348 RepID=A0A3P7J253_STRVU|nr:unnamed protein product [Strongylus vulgaris]